MATLYDQIGGAPAVALAVDEFYGRVVADPALAPWFTRIDMRRQRGHLRAFLAAALGGPAGYRGREMGAAHAGLGITAEAFDRVVGHLVDTLGHLQVPGEIIQAIGAKLLPLRTHIVAA